MKISVIIPVYNTAEYIDRCVESLLAQTHSDLEIILADTGSTDNSMEKCRMWAGKDSRIKHLNVGSGGPSAGRNRGIEIATGEYFLFVDSDDCVSPFYAEKLLNMALENGTKLAVCGYSVNDGATSPRQVGVPLMLYDTEIIDKRNYFLRLYSPQEIVYVVVWNKIYHRSLFDGVRYAHGKYNEDEGIVHHIIDRCERIAVSYEPLYFYTVRRGSIMAQKEFTPRHLDAFEMLGARAEYFMEKSQYDLAFLTMKSYMIKCLEMYNNIKPDTADGDMYRKHIMEMFNLMLKKAGANPVNSKKFLLAMRKYSLFPKSFKNADKSKL